MNYDNPVLKVIGFPTCSTGCASTVRPGEFTLSNNTIMPVWICSVCGATLVTLVSRKVLYKSLICRYEYEEAAHIALKEDDKNEH
jgi:hypothetical protein